MPEQQNITNIPSSRVEVIDPRTGMISREWYRFFLNLFNLAGSGGNQTSLDDLQVGPPPQPASTSGSGTVTSVDVSGGTTGITTSGGPVTTSGTITLGLTGQLQTPTAIQMGNGSATTLAAGKMWYDQTTGSWNLGMGNGNITQQVGEELFIYGKASAAITDSPLQIVYHTGTVGASGVIKFAPTVAGITDVNAILGIATENIALNGFGRVTTYGVVHGITTNGTAFGETWVDDDVIWYNPVTGNPTNVEPTAPNIKIQIGLVINAGAGGSGSFQVGVGRGSTLGGTDSNVKFGALANSDLIAYDSTLGYWKNIPGSSYGTGTVTSVALALPSIMSVSGSPVTTTGTLTGTLTTQSVNTLFAGPSSGAAAAPTFRALTTTDIPSLSYVSSVGATAPITSTGGLTPTIGVTAAALSKTDDTNVTMTLSGSPSTALIAATTMALGWTGQLAVSRGGTGAATTTANFIFAGPSSGAPAAPTFRALTTADIPSLSYVTSVALALPSIMSVSGSPVTSSGTLTGTLTTQAVNAIFAGPSSGAAAAPTFRSLTTADIPALSYVTSVAATVPAFLSISGSPITSSGTLAISYSGTALPIANGGTGQTTASAAFNALSPVTSTGDLIIGNGTNSATRLAIGANNYVLTSNGTTATWAVATGSGATITNDTATSTNLYPLFAAATSGALANVYTGNANYLYKPSTGELTSSAMISGNGIQINSKTVATSYTIATGNNGLSAGPVSVSTGVTVTVSTGSTWVVV